MPHTTARLQSSPVHGKFTTVPVAMDVFSAARLAKISEVVLQTFQCAVNNVNATESDMWQGPGDLTWLTTPAAVTVVSSSINDTDGGSGARKVSLFGMTDQGVVGVAFATLDGTTPVSTTDSEGNPSGNFFRIFKITVIESGSNGEAMSDGDIDALIGGVLQDRTYPGRNTSYSGFLTIPIGTVSYIQAISVRSEIGLELDVQFRPLGEAFRSIHYQTTAAAVTHEDIPLQELSAGSDMRIRARRGGGGSGDASVALRMAFVDVIQAERVPLIELIP